MENKTCTKCKEIKPINCFGKNKQGKNGINSRCKSCHLDQWRHYQQNNSQKVKVQLRKSELKREYNITLEDYNLMFKQQNGCCAICNKHQSELSKTLSVDHCHITGEVRGLLCNGCNRGMGMLGDNIQILKNAVKYLSK
jgi:hypothetical protein